VVLTGGDVDAIAGLLVLRERQALSIYATGATHTILTENSIFGVLSPEHVVRRQISIGETVALAEADGTALGLSVEFFAVPGKVPLYLEAAGEAPPIVESASTVAALVTDGTRRLFFIPGCAAMTDPLADRLDGADVVLFDGTLFTDDEMIRAGIGPKTGQRMGHMSLAGSGGTLAAFEPIDVRRKILIHINNSNPILLDDSPERAAVEQAGWEVAYDGMEITP
jgi:pyrroloquinoline quinone biosynthesis protein B